jgi:hypothetical protein
MSIFRAFGSVSYAKDPTGKSVAVKILPHKSSLQQLTNLHELSLVAFAKHPNICSHYGTYLFEEKIWVSERSSFLLVSSSLFSPHNSLLLHTRFFFLPSSSSPSPCPCPSSPSHLHLHLLFLVLITSSFTFTFCR